MLAASVLILGSIQPPAGLLPAEPLPQVRKLEQRAPSVFEEHEELNRRAEEAQRVANEAIKDIKRLLKEMEELDQQFEKKQKFKQK